MCGICGFVTDMADHRGWTDDVLRRMCAVLRHRGPDDEGMLSAGRARLGMRRLCVIDLAGGHQPMSNETGTVHIVFNGEIYNYRRLATELASAGHIFRSKSDTEVIVHGWEQWGEDVVSHLAGMFAFAIWDERRQRLFVARDRLGKKPIYYAKGPGFVVFASEIKAILESPAVPRELDLEALDAYLALGYVPAPRTMFRAVRKLPAGHTLVVEDGTCRITGFWDVQPGRCPATLEEATELVSDLVTEAVKDRLISDVPIGAFLSGGLDSSLIVSLMSGMLREPVKTFSVGFEDPAQNELPHARIVASHLGTDHREIVLRNCSRELVERVVWHFDEPVADPAAVPTLLLAELARQQVTVVLTGEGGDEVFGGYSYYRRLSNAERWFRSTALGTRLLPAWGRVVNQLLRRAYYHDRTLWEWSLTPPLMALPAVAVFSPLELDRCCTPALREHVGPPTGAALFAEWYERHGGDHVQRMQYRDTKLWLAEDLLMKVDKMTMAASLEARTPYLDHRLVELMSGVPAAIKTAGGVPKRVLRDVAKNLLPPEIIVRRKHTFDVPIDTWLRTSLRACACDLLEDQDLFTDDLFNRAYLAELWPRLDAGDAGAARQIWALMILGLWARRFGVDLTV